jgi:hypothetical protein
MTNCEKKDEEQMMLNCILILKSYVLKWHTITVFQVPNKIGFVIFRWHVSIV